MYSRKWDLEVVLLIELKLPSNVLRYLNQWLRNLQAEFPEVQFSAPVKEAAEWELICSPHSHYLRQKKTQQKPVDHSKIEDITKRITPGDTIV